MKTRACTCTRGRSRRRCIHKGFYGTQRPRVVREICWVPVPTGCDRRVHAAYPSIFYTRPYPIHWVHAGFIFWDTRRTRVLGGVTPGSLYPAYPRYVVFSRRIPDSPGCLKIGMPDIPGCMKVRYQCTRLFQDADTWVYGYSGSGVPGISTVPEENIRDTPAKIPFEGSTTGNLVEIRKSLQTHTTCFRSS